MPLFAWAVLVTAVLLLLSLPVLAGILVPALNLAVCWELFFHSSIMIEDNQQVTLMNSMSKRNLNDCAPELSIKLMTTPFLASYLAGLIEGDGTIIVPSQERSSKGKLNYASIQIVFRSTNFPVITLLCQVLGYGSISKKKQSAAYVYTINNLDGLIDIANLINGKMRGPKYNQYIQLIEYINKKSPNLNLVVLPADQSSLGSNSWLTGFIEADGSFQVRASLQSKIQKRLGLSFELSQSRITHYGHSTLHLMETIGTFLGVNVNSIREDRKNPQYRVRTNTIQSNQKVRDYLMEYPLQGTKYLDFKDWCVVLELFENDTHWENKDQIVEIKNHMNQYRTEFNWDHLTES
jgi:hypothetical protein